jgi:alanyl-tRNA synthetase
MPAKKVYHKDPYLTELYTEPASLKEEKNGSWYSFNETIFYPQGGGQSSDKGWINSIDVLDVQLSDGEVWHLVNNPINGTASMRLDWDHRYTNMQQHSGQHILSACLKNYHNLDTVSVHLGRDITMIELEASEVEDSVLENVEEITNKMIRNNLPIESIEVNRSELNEYSVRRAIKTKDDRVRLVRIGEIDCVGCGGIHVRSTSEIGLIKITGIEKIRGHVRIKMKIGASAYHYFGQLHNTLQKVSTQLSTSVEDLSERVESLLAEKRDLITEKKKITELWLSEITTNLTSEGNTGCFVLKDFSKDQLKILSENYLNKYQKPCLFLSEETGRIHFYIRFPQNINKNVQEFVQKCKSKFALKGGGAKDFAVGQIDGDGDNRYSSEKLFQSFKQFVNERSSN